MREIGDRYVKKEFRAIAVPSMSTNPATDEQFRIFLQKWEEYAGTNK
jgi:hypothetical protein